jgi:Mitogen-activated protein kinase kinase 1 interacting
MARYSKRGVTVHVNFSPLVLSLIGDDNMNCGVIHSLYDQLDNILKPFQRVVAEADE